MAQTLDRFGALGDGRADDTEALQRAVEWSANRRGETVRALPGAVHRLTDRILVRGALDLDLGDAEMVLDAEQAGLRAVAPLVGPVPLTRDYRTGDVTLSVDIPQEMPLPGPGDWIKIVSDALDPAQRDQGTDRRVYAIGEWARLAEGSTRKALTLEQPLRQRRGIAPGTQPGDEPEIAPWTTRAGARIVWARPEPFRLSGGRWAHPQGRTGWSAATIEIVGHLDPEIDRVRILRGYSTGFRLFGTQRALLRDCHVESLPNNVSEGQFGYGVALGGDRATVVTGLTGRMVRHLFTTSTARMAPAEDRAHVLIGQGRTEGAEVRDGRADSVDAASWDTHQDAYRVRFLGVSAEGGRGGAISLRGREVSAQDVAFSGMQHGLQAFTDYASGQEEDDLFLNGNRRADFTQAFIADYEGDCAEQPIRVRTASLTLAGRGRISSGDPRGLDLSGGVVTVTGAHRISAGRGPWPVPDDADALIRIDPSHGKAWAAFGAGALDVAGLLEIDASQARRGGLRGLRLGEGTVVRVWGLLVLHLPSDAAGLRTGTGRLEILGGGAVATTTPERRPARLLLADGSERTLSRADLTAMIALMEDSVPSADAAR